MESSISLGIEETYNQRTDFLVLALTGRTGSGCTTAAGTLSKHFKDISINTTGLATQENRKLAIVSRFCEAQWKPFKVITISTLIFSFLLSKDSSEVHAFLDKIRVSDANKIIVILNNLKSSEHYEEFNRCIVEGRRDSESRAWIFYEDSLKNSIAEVRQILENKYTSVFQTLGNNIRMSGDALSSDEIPDQLFTLIRRVKRLTKAAFTHEKENGEDSVRVVIDAVRNPLELVYLRDQFAAFYAVALTCDDSDRIERLQENGLSKKEVKAIDEKEYSEKKKHLDSYESFVSQNIQDCIQKSDIFLANSGKLVEYVQNIRILNTQIVRYVSLMLRPGLVTPTGDERCMQLAFVAKLNSGCISRQVGAALADQHRSVKSVGWNDVPKGQVPCLLRDVDELLTGGDVDAFSTFEKTDQKFITQIKQTFLNRGSVKAIGLPCPYCFKREYNKSIKTENQVHTRSLHAEENAFLQLTKHGGAGIEGGFLYTTASPCELCSKKAFQLGIREIVYVDPYPGISSSHILSSGDHAARPNVRLFNGAIGHAYHRLYEPILPIKDEYLARLASDPQRPLI